MSWSEARLPRVRPQRIQGNPGRAIGAHSRALNPQTLRPGRFRIAIALRPGTNFHSPKNAAALVWPNALFELMRFPPFLSEQVSRCFRPAPWQCPNLMRVESRQLFLE